MGKTARVVLPDMSHAGTNWFSLTIAAPRQITRENRMHFTESRFAHAIPCVNQQQDIWSMRSALKGEISRSARNDTPIFTILKLVHGVANGCSKILRDFIVIPTKAEI